MTLDNFFQILFPHCILIKTSFYYKELVNLYNLIDWLIGIMNKYDWTIYIINSSGKEEEFTIDD